MAKEKKPEILPYKIFIGDRPWEDFSQEEKEAYARKAADRMGRVFNDYFSQHPEEYAKI